MSSTELPDEPLAADETDEGVARVIAEMLTRQVGEAAADGEPLPPVPAHVAKRREIIAREVFDRLVIDKRVRAIRDTDMLRALVISWDAHLTNEGVPTRDIRRVYELAVGIYRLKADHNFNVFDLLAGWDALKEARRRERERAASERVRSRRYMVDTLRSSCLRCLSGGMERMYDSAGEFRGVRPGCLHEPIHPEVLKYYIADPVAMSFYKSLQQEGQK